MNFPEKYTRHIAELANKPNGDKIRRQFIRTDYEDNWEEKEGRTMHYDASTDIPNFEKLYNDVCVVELTYHCQAHCRYCLRRGYEPKKVNLVELAKAVRESGCSEVLITGGDPLTRPKRVDEFIGMIKDDIDIIRIATRLFTHDPEEIPLAYIEKWGKSGRIEIATQINCVEEFSEEADMAIKRIRELGIVIYNQSVILSGVNDDVNSLVDLCRGLRKRGIENHYLFPCVRLKWAGAFHRDLEMDLKLYNELVNYKKISGRSKPKLAIMKECGKWIPTEI